MTTNSNPSNPCPNFRGGLLQPGEELPNHPAALKFRAVKGHEESLRHSLTEHGQLTEATVFECEDGSQFLIDGVTRRKILHGLGQPLRYRLVQSSDIGDRSVEQWILENNLKGAEARKLNDTQRAVQVADFKDVFSAAAALRSKAGQAAKDSEKGRTEEHLAKLANCSPSRVSQVLNLKKKQKANLIEAVWEGTLSISTAIKLLDKPEEVQRAAIDAAKRKDKPALAAILDGPPKDEFGVIVPSELSWLSRCSASIKKAGELIDESSRLLETFPQLDFPCQALRKIANDLEDKHPVVCPFCRGAGRACHVCEGRFWVTRSEHLNAHETAYELVRSSDQRQSHRPTGSGAKSEIAVISPISSQKG
jgi:tellurite resistance protein